MVSGLRGHVYLTAVFFCVWVLAAAQLDKGRGRGPQRQGSHTQTGGLPGLQWTHLGTCHTTTCTSGDTRAPQVTGSAQRPFLWQPAQENTQPSLATSQMPGKPGTSVLWYSEQGPGPFSSEHFALENPTSAPAPPQAFISDPSQRLHCASWGAIASTPQNC